MEETLARYVRIFHFIVKSFLNDCQVKILYVRNLMLSTTEEHLEEVFTKAADPQPPGKKAVERVKKLKDYAFIHFSERDEALRALKAINGMSKLRKKLLDRYH